MSDAWIERQLVDIVGLDKGVTYASSDYSDVNEGLPFFTIKCVQKGGGFNWSGVKFYSGPFLPNQALKCGDILLALTDLTRAGDIIGSPIAVPNFPGADTILASMDLCKLRPITDQIDTTFLYYRLMLADVRAFMLAHSAGSTVLHLEKKSLPSLKFDFPPLLQQQTIAKIITTVDNLIENAHSLIAKYNAIKQGMMRDLFTRGVEKDGNLRPFYNESPQKYCETPFGYIPKDWKINRLPEVCSYQTGKAFPSVQYRDAGIPLLRPGNLQADEYVVWDKGHTICLPHFWADVAKDYLVYENELVMNLTAQSLEEEFLGRVCLTGPNTKCLLNQRIARFRQKSCLIKFLFWAFKAPLFRLQIDQLTQGTKVQHIYNSNLNSIMLAIPDRLSEQEQIAEKLFSISEMISSETKRFQKLAYLKHGLMQDLLTGKVRVKVDESTGSKQDVGVVQS